jgi:trk system potassium uptake protein TrkH
MAMNLLTLERYKPGDLTLLLHLGPLYLIYLLSLPTKSYYLELGDYEPYLAGILTIVLVVGSGLLLLQKTIGRYLMHISLIAGLALTVNHFFERPSRCLLTAVLVLGCMKLIQSIGTIRLRARGRMATIEYPYEMTFFSALINLAIAVLVFFLAIASGPLVYTAIIYGNILNLFLLIISIRGQFFPLKSGLLAQSLMLGAVSLMAFYLPNDTLLNLSQFLVLIPVGTFLFTPIRRQLRRRIISSAESLFLHPEGAVVMFFLIICTIGTVILYAPVSAASTEGLSLLDSAFTAVSAACVTGLVVLDTVSDFSYFGQFIIVLLIQVGGLGIMTMSSLLILFVGRRLTLMQEDAIVDSSGTMLRGEVFSSLKKVLYVTFTAESIGAMILTFMFLTTGDSLPTALWRGVFTAISAFCNAGFALQPASMIPYQSHPGILHTVAVLVILGGLSPTFILSMSRLFRGPQLPLQFRLVAFANAVLLVGGTLVFLLLEWNQSLGGLDLSDKLHNSWFQSVTSRTAGFNSLDMNFLQPATQFILMTLMFIGGSPGGTAGGIRVTTFMILLFTVLSVAKGQTEVRAFQRNISRKTVYRATTVATCGLLTGFFGLLSLLTTQKLDPVEALFETISALGTVGLSMGTTAELDQIGKVIIMLVMFLGRVGSLSVILYLGQQTKRANWKIPEEDISVA